MVYRYIYLCIRWNIELLAFSLSGVGWGEASHTHNYFGHPGTADPLDQCLPKVATGDLKYSPFPLRYTENKIHIGFQRLSTQNAKYLSDTFFVLITC